MSTTDPRMFTGTLTLGSPVNVNCTLTAKCIQYTRSLCSRGLRREG
jgi:hypothetical protein